LLAGPPGTGKTMIVHAAINEAFKTCGVRFSFLAISPSVVLSKWSGEAEKRIKKVFELAKTLAPSIGD